MKTKIPSKTRLQIAEEYDIRYQTLYRRLKKRNIEIPDGILLPKSQKLIYDALGYPNGVSKEDYEDI